MRLLQALNALTLMAGLLVASWATPAAAQGFGASISPPRFELQIKAGQTQREVIEIQHIGTQNGTFRVYTNDWTFQADGSLAFTNDLAEGSCRPWVAVERRDLTITSNARYRYRFEITAPADTPPRECRFAIMIEGTDPARVEQSGFNIPVGGRIAVIVYAAIGGAEPQLAITDMRVLTANGQSVPTLAVRNTGNAHGRLEGFLNGVDAAGNKFELSPADLPILPGETKTIGILAVSEERQKIPVIQFPLVVKGTIEWGKTRVPLEHTFAK